MYDMTVNMQLAVVCLPFTMLHYFLHQVFLYYVALHVYMPVGVLRCQINALLLLLVITIKGSLIIWIVDS